MTGLEPLIASGVSAAGGLLSKYGAKILATGLFNKAQKYIQTHGIRGTIKNVASTVNKGINTARTVYNKAKDVYNDVKDKVATVLPEGKVKNWVTGVFKKIDNKKNIIDKKFDQVENKANDIHKRVDSKIDDLSRKAQTISQYGRG